MSKPVTYSVLIRNGRKRCYEDLWVPLHRELLWGPDAFEAWLSQGHEIDGEPEELSGVAIVDFDAQQLRWGERDVFNLPRAQAMHHRLLEQAWPGFTITYLSDNAMSAAACGTTDPEPALEDRPETVADAARQFDDDNDSDGETQQEDDFDCDANRATAWLTIIDEDGRARQRVLEELPADLITGNKSALQELLQLDAAAIPPEKCVTEGLWFNRRDTEIGYWGGERARRDLAILARSWPEWNVFWAGNGYADQCAVSELPGSPVTDAEALARFIPQVLSVQKFDMAHVLGTVSGELRKTAMKATGCLVFVLAVPILLTGAFLDKLREAGSAIASLIVIAAVAFKVIEVRVTAKFRRAQFGTGSETPDTKPAVAGPLDDEKRREGVDRMLRACGFPSLAELEPHFADSPSLPHLM